MKLEALMQSMNEDSRRPQIPEYLIWMPPSGAPVECPPGFDIVQAGKTAAKIAAAHPGRTIAVYSLVGSARAPVIEPEFTPASNEPFAVEAEQQEPKSE
jgi:hypothetical protein